VSSEAPEPVQVLAAPGETFGHDTLTDAGRAVSLSLALCSPGCWKPMIVAVILSLASAGTIYFACEFLVNVVEWLVTLHAPMLRTNRPLPARCSHIRIHSRA
jgi:hypothetical protein